MTAMSVWKYEFGVDARRRFDMPKSAKIVSVHEQNGRVCLWALVDPKASLETRYFILCGTGQKIDIGPVTYLGTAHLMGGNLVLHVFEDLS